MKKYFIGTFAVAAALVCFAFTTNSNKLINCNPSTDYIWFQVKTSTVIDCANYAAVTQSQIDPAGHFAPSTTSPLADLTADGFLLKQGTLGISGAEQKFGCNTNDLVCAVAYLQSDVTPAKFDRVNINGTFYWLPKDNTDPVCAICKD